MDITLKQNKFLHETRTSRFRERGVGSGKFFGILPQQSVIELPQKSGKIEEMKSKITYWTESDGKFLGYLNEYPDHWTQGDNLDDLKDHLRDLYKEFRKGDLPGIRKVEEIEVG